MAENFKYRRFKAIWASDLKCLFEQLDDEPRPFELVVHPPIGKTGTRPVTIKASTEEDAKYFKDFPLLSLMGLQMSVSGIHIV